jgi:SAM-dependent methyltransferase
MLSLEEKLKRVDKVFGIDKIATKSVEMEDVKRYYRTNKLPYKLFHSKKGFVHVGITRDGKFNEKDLYEQLKYIEKYISKLNAKKVLELAAGKCANLFYLAEKFPSMSFSGLDLPDGQFNVNDKRAKSLENISLFEGDYHDLRIFGDEEFDIVFIIEALCYSDKKEIVAKEVKRILKPGGVFILIDGYLSRSLDELSESEKVCHSICAKGMMLHRYYLYENVRDGILEVGFDVVQEDDLSKYVVPTTRRHEKFASTVLFDRHLIGKLIANLFPTDFSYNAAFGYLSPEFLEMGIGRYVATVFKKR